MNSWNRVLNDMVDSHICYTLGITKACLEEVLAKLREPHRFYHNLDHHVAHLFDLIDASSYIWSDKDILKIIALYHDAVYIPMSTTNEKDSADYFLKSIFRPNTVIAKMIAEAIEDTDVTKNEYRNRHSKSFSLEFDLHNLMHGPEHVWLDDSIRIFKEYQKAPWPLFKEKNIEFMKNLKGMNPDLAQGCDFHIDWASYFRPKIGLYAGSFNPFHIGHLDVLEQAEKIFDKVIVAVGRNIQKTNSSRFDLDKVLPFHETFMYYDMLSDEIRKHSSYADIVLVRGLRSGYDLNYEEKLLRHLQDEIPDVNVVYLCCKSDLGHISSSSVREISYYDKKKAGRYLPNKYDYYEQV